MAVCFDGNSMKISYTQVTTYQRCPHKYQLAYVDRIPVPKTPNLHLGNVVHGALSFMHKPGNLALPAQEAIIAEFCRLWQAEQAEIPEDQRDSYFQQGVEMLQRHYAREQSHTDRRQTATVEQYFSIPFAQDDNIAGRIDRVDVLDNGVLEVLDYKTGRRMPAQTDVNADLQHHFPRQGMNAGRLNASTIDLEAVSAVLAQKGLGHLAARRVGHADKQDFGLCHSFLRWRTIRSGR